LWWSWWWWWSKKKIERRRQFVSSLDSFIIMLQKAKTIKKTIKTEVKAIVHGQERVDKLGKPVTSIADRTNVSALSSFFPF